MGERIKMNVRFCLPLVIWAAKAWMISGLERNRWQL